MPIDRTRLQVRALNRKRQRYSTTNTLIILSGSSEAPTETTYTDDWYLDDSEYDDLATGKHYYKLYVGDLNKARRLTLQAAIGVRVNGYGYKFASKDLFIGKVRVYEFKVYPTGESL